MGGGVGSVLLAGAKFQLDENSTFSAFTHLNGPNPLPSMQWRELSSITNRVV